MVFFFLRWWRSLVTISCWSNSNLLGRMNAYFCWWNCVLFILNWLLVVCQDNLAIYKYVVRQFKTYIDILVVDKQQFHFWIVNWISLNAPAIPSVHTVWPQMLAVQVGSQHMMPGTRCPVWGTPCGVAMWPCQCILPKYAKMTISYGERDDCWILGAILIYFLFIRLETCLVTTQIQTHD